MRVLNLVPFVLVTMNYMELVYAIGYKLQTSKCFSNGTMKRYRRFVIFDSQTSILVTAVMSKAVLNPAPTGTSLVLELNDYLPLPDNLEDWKPKRLRKPKPTMSHKKYSSDFEEYKTVHQSDYEILKMKNDFRNKISYKPNYANALTHWPTSSTKWINGYDKIQYSYIPPLSYSIPLHFDHTDYTPHRERREIYKSIETFAKRYGVDAKACVLRAICEAKHFLLPRGKSLIQDIIRIVFDLSLHVPINDDYNLASKKEKDDCLTIYGMNCRFSIVDFLLTNQVASIKL